MLFYNRLAISTTHNDENGNKYNKDGNKGIHSVVCTITTERKNPRGDFYLNKFLNPLAK